MLEVIFLGISRGRRITTLGRVLTRTQVKRRGYKFGAILLKGLRFFSSICNGYIVSYNDLTNFLLHSNFFLKPCKCQIFRQMAGCQKARKIFNRFFPKKFPCFNFSTSFLKSLNHIWFIWFQFFSFTVCQKEYCMP